MMLRYVTAPDHTAACDLGPATVLMNYQTGDVQVLHGSPARWWAELAATGDTTATTALDRSAAEALLSQLHGVGLLIATEQPRPWPAPKTGRPLLPSWGTQEVQAGRIPTPPVPSRSLPTAAVALLIVLTVTHIGPTTSRMARLTRLLRWVTRRTVRPATTEHARQAIDAVRHAGTLAPGRVACLEESAAAVLMLAASRHRVTWCHGVAADPIRLHAWVETDGQPVAEPPSTLRYTRLCTI